MANLEKAEDIDQQDQRQDGYHRPGDTDEEVYASSSSSSDEESHANGNFGNTDTVDDEEDEDEDGWVPLRDLPQETEHNIQQQHQQQEEGGWQAFFQDGSGGTSIGEETATSNSNMAGEWFELGKEQVEAIKTAMDGFSLEYRPWWAGERESGWKERLEEKLMAHRREGAGAVSPN